MNHTEQTIGIFTTDVTLKIRSWDSWLAGVTGLTADVVRDINLLDIFPEIPARGQQDHFQRVLSGGGLEKFSPPAYPYLIPCLPRTYSKRFEYMQQQVTIAPLREANGIVGTIVTVEDVTPQLDREHELQELSSQLKSTDESLRVRAAQSLAKQNEPGHNADKLVEALGDESWRVRQVAVENIIQSGGADAVTTLVRKIRDQHHDMSVLNSALKALTQMKGDIIGPLTELLQIPDPDLRGYVVLALGDQQDRRAIPALMELLNDENQNVRYNAVEALGKLQAVEAIQLLATITESGDFFLAFPALDALKRISDPSILPRLIPLLEDELLRDPTIEVIGVLGNETAIEPLATLLNQQDTPTITIACAIATLFDRYEEFFNEGNHIADLTCQFMTAPGMQNLLTALHSAKDRELRALALLLGWLEGDVVERALTQLLGKPTIQREVIKALTRYSTRVVDLLIEQLQGTNLETRLAALTVLERLGDRRAVPAMTRILQVEEDEALIIATANALSKIGDPQAFESLLTFLGHPVTAVRQAAVAALSSLNHPEMKNRAIILLQESNPYVRESAAKILGYIGYPESLELLLTHVHDPHESVRQAVIESLPYFEKQEDRIIPILADALEQDTPRIRAAAARALAEIDHQSVITYLRRSALNDSDAWVRYFAARALGSHKATDAWKVLVQMAQYDEANQVRLAAIEALGQLGEVQAIGTLTRLSQVAETDLAAAALQALGHIPHSAALPPLLATLRSSYLSRQLDAIRALGQHREGEAVAALAQVVATEEQNQLVQAAIEALAHIATPVAIQALIALTANPKRREACIRVLSALGSPQIDWLENGLSHEHVGVRSAIVDTLSRIKHPKATRQLIIALTDKEASVRLATVTALGRLDLDSAKPQLQELASNDPNLAVRRAAQNILKRA